MRNDNKRREQGISVVICCYNSATRIVPTLEHLARQRIDEAFSWEVMLVDNNCKDETVAVARRTWEELGQPVPLRVLVEPTPGLGNARTAGFMSARYDLLVFVDDDNWLEDNWLQIAHDSLRSSPCLAAVGGSIIPEFESVPPAWISFYTSLLACGEISGNTLDILPRGTAIAGAGLGIRAVAFEQFLHDYGGFTLCGRRGSSTTSGDDIELMYVLSLLGWRVGMHGGLTLKHQIPSQRCGVEYLESLSCAIGQADNILDPLRRVATVSTNGRKVKFLELYYFVKAASVVSQLLKTVIYIPSAGRGVPIFRTECIKRLKQLVWLIRFPNRYMTEVRRARQFFNRFANLRVAEGGA